MSTEFSRTLSLLRKERGVSQRMAAADLGVSQALLSHYENGIREPGLAFVVKACDYYHVSADYMLGRTLARDGSMLTPEEVLDMAEPGPMYYRAACWLRCGASSLPAPAACCSACWESWATRPPSMRRQTVWLSDLSAVPDASPGRRRQPEYFALPEEDCASGTASAGASLAQADYARAIRNLAREKANFPDLSHEAVNNAYPGPESGLRTGTQHGGRPAEPSEPEERNG